MQQNSGGSWNNDDNYLRSTRRPGNAPGERYRTFGLRCARSAP